MSPKLLLLTKITCTFLLIAAFFLPMKSIAQTPGTLTFTVTPLPHTGNWGSKHVLAIWIQNNTDNFVRTKFRYWGNGTNDHLPNWKSNSNQNIVDAVTGPTLTSYTTKTLSWDGTDLTGSLMPDGDYKITIEECWSHGSSKVTKSFIFTKNETESHLTPADDANFIDVAIDWVPTATGIASTELSGNFAVYPNPAQDKIYINFAKNTETCHIAVLDELGKEVYSEKANHNYQGIHTIDLSNQENGIYFVLIEKKSGTQARKIVLVR